MKAQLLAAVNEVVNQHITQLIEQYEQQAIQLKMENLELKEKIKQLQDRISVLEVLPIDFLRGENKVLSEKIASLEKATINKAVPFTKPASPYDWLTAWRQATKTNNYERIKALIADARIQKSIIAKLPSKEHVNFAKLLLQTFNSPNDERIDPIVVDMLISLAEMPHANKVKTLLEQEAPTFLANIIPMPELILKTLRMLSLYKLSGLVDQHVLHIIQNHWDTAISHFTQEQFSKLFWYAFIAEAEELFLLKSQEKMKWLTENNDLTAVYFALQNSPLKKGQFKKMKKPLTNRALFTFDERERIRVKLNTLFQMKQLQEGTQLALSTNAKYVMQNDLYVIKDSAKDKCIEKFSLQPTKVMVALYDQNNQSKTGEYAVLPALSNPGQQTAYITVSQLESLQKQYAPSRIGVSSYYLNFKWPSTELTELAEEKKDFVALRPESPLKKMGYNNPNLGDEQRWSILTRAVQDIGLQRVAYTIASNAKRLKGRKPDSPTIAKWENDLQRLKKEFYKKNFSWPKV